MKSTTLYYFLMIGIFLFSACGSTEEPPKEEEIIEEETVDISGLMEGRWETTEVLRNGNSLDSDFFVEFSSDGIFTSNLFNIQQELPFESGVKATLDGYSISFENLPDTFHVSNISENELVLSTAFVSPSNIRLPFEFTFEKK